MPFAENLRSELDYQGLIVKQLSAKTGVNLHTLNHYLAGKKSMPPADVAVKIAAALGVTVEYLVTGSEQRNKAAAKTRDSAYLKEEFSQFKEVLDNLLLLPMEMREPIVAMIDAAARREQRDKRRK
jgi:transcriptional regulator with XRE-family HTH domain